MNQLSAWTVFKESTQFTYSNLKTFGKIWLSVFLLNLGLTLSFMLLSSIVNNSLSLTSFSLKETAGTSFGALLLIPQFLISIYISSTLGSRWIQFYNAPGKIKWFQFKKAEWQFFKYYLLLIGVFLGAVAAAAIPAWPFVNFVIIPLYNDQPILSVILTILVGLPALFGLWILGIRLSFMGPAAALLHPTGLKESWRQTRPYQTQLFYFGLLLLLIIAAPLLLFPLGSLFTVLSCVLFVICSGFFGGVSYVGLTKFYQTSQRQ